ncbi:MAG: hypothetical protein UHK60_04720 [Acutalibacteraceae bacterium]|nr:hypothetical protein [Acutalibacteraceae bacterium]
MEMSYNGALVMPSNFVAIENDEMEYVEGGWSFGRLCSNICGLAGMLSGVKWLAQKTVVKGKTVWTWIVGGYNLAKTKAISMLSGFVAKIGLSAAACSRILAAALVVSAVAAIGVLGQYQLFY